MENKMECISSFLEKEIRDFIDIIEPRLDKLWNTLSFFKGDRSERIMNEIATFQVDMADCQVLINDKYIHVRDEIRQFRQSRHSYSKTDKVIDEKLSNLEYVIKQLIHLSKGIGDAYAWFFLRNEPDILFEHLQRSDDLLLPSGHLGRLGEIEFIRANKTIKGNIVIYHGITNLLRIGDISLINPKTMTLTGIGELKTDSKTGNSLQMRMIVFGKKDRINKSFKGRNDKSTNREPNQSSQREERLERQIEAMLSALKVYSDDPVTTKQANIENKSYLLHLDDFFKNIQQNPISYKKAGDGMLFIGIKSNSHKLSDRLFETDLLEQIDNEKLSEHYMSIFDANSENNEQLIGTIHYSRKGGMNVLAGVKPLFWTDLPQEYSKQIYFFDLILVTIYNPLYFRRELEKRGFRFEFVASQNKRCLVKNRGEELMVIDRFGYFLKLIKNHLIDEKTVLEMIDELTGTAQNLSGNTRVEMKFIQQ